MADNEEVTVRTLQLYFQLMTSLIEQHRGRVVDSPGDNLLAEFGSVVDAVQGAMAIQLELHARNRELPAKRKMQFRIGINLGDIVADGDRIYGDGVNIASRVEGLAEAGGICISGTVHEHIKNKLPLGYESLGDQAVKNINEPIAVYRVQVLAAGTSPQIPIGVDPITSTAVPPPAAPRFSRSTVVMGVGLAIAVSAVAMLLLTRSPGRSPQGDQALAQPTGRAEAPAPQPRVSAVAARSAPRPQSGTRLVSHTPSAPAAIGVMNFKALVPNAETSWMSEAIRDNLNGQLNKVSGLEVYSKEFIDFLAEDGDTNELKVAQELGIDRMVSGSYIASGDRLRIEAHVVNVKTGLLEVSDFVEGPQSQFFEMQTELAFKIAGHMDIRVSPESQAVIASSGRHSDLNALKLLMEAEDDGVGLDPSLEYPSDVPSSRREDSFNDSAPDLWREIGQWLEASGLGVGAAWAETGLDAEAEILDVLERYRQAYEAKDLDLLSSVYAELTPKQRAARQRYFQNTDNLAVEINDVRIAVRGDDAVASYTRADQFKDRKSGELVKLDIRLTKKLHRMDDGWKLVSSKKSK